MDQSPQPLRPTALEKLESLCPELTSKYGNNFCCDYNQIVDLEKSFAYALPMISRCPSCLRNFRQGYCDFACSPYQYRFINVNTTIHDEEEEGDLGRPSAYSLNFFIGNEYAEKTYESCKDVILSSTNAPALNVLCGPWGSYHCNPKRWFDYMGDAEGNVYTPFTMHYQFMDVVDEGVEINGTEIVGYNNVTYACSEVPPVCLTCSTFPGFGTKWKVFVPSGSGFAL